MSDGDESEDERYSFYCAKCGWETKARRRPVGCHVCGGRMLATPSDRRR